MKPVVFLRIASAVTLIHSILHTLGGVFGKPEPGAATMVVATMRGYRFPVFGVMRSYSDFYMGLGLAVTIFLTVEAIVFWLLASMAKSDASRIRPLLAVFLIGYLAMAVNSLLFFFAGPVVVELIIGLCLAAAIVTAKSATQYQAHGTEPPLKATQS